MLYDLSSDLDISRALSAQTQTNSDTALVSQIIDTANYGGLVFGISIGALTDADATFTVLVEDGDDAALADAAAVADAYLVGIEGVAATPTGASFKFSSDDKASKIGYIGGKRYVRLTITPSGNNSGAASLAVLAIRSRARVKPRSTQLQ